MTLGNDFKSVYFNRISALLNHISTFFSSVVGIF